MGLSARCPVSLLWLKSVKENMGATTADAAATRLSQTAWGLSWEHLFGNIQALAQRGKTANVSGCVTAEHATTPTPPPGRSACAM